MGRAGAFFKRGALDALRRTIIMGRCVALHA
jgi:hypothetical protein